MKYIVPQILKNKLAFVEAEIIQELTKLIAKMQELDLKETGYKFHLENGDEVIIREVLIEEDGVLSFAVEEYFDDDSGANFTVVAEEITTDNLLALYNMYYANNISTINAVGDENPMCKKYPDSEALPDEDGNCSLCGGNCVDE